MKTLSSDLLGRQRLVRAFTILEVMIASAIFFLAVFAILGLVSNTLRNARGLRRAELDAGMAAAQLVIKTNKFTKGIESGDFGDLYPGYSWKSDCNEVATNGLLQFDIAVFKQGVSAPVDTLSILVFSPDSVTGPFGGGFHK
jgi:hypothetical protein